MLENLPNGIFWVWPMGSPNTKLKFLASWYDLDSLLLNRFAFVHNFLVHTTAMYRLR